MNARNSQLVSPPAFKAVIEGQIGASLDWINRFALPLPMAPMALLNPQTGLSLSNELTNIYNFLSAPGSVTVSGGFVAASKAAHCLFPNLSPMIDGAHTGISYYNITRVTFTPPLFEAMGFHDVIEFHGALEFGKDIVFYEEDKFGERIYYSVAVKAQDIHGSVGKSGNASEVLFQA